MRLTGVGRATILLVILTAAGTLPAQAQSVTGSIAYPCGDPALRYVFVTSTDTGGQGVCGWKFLVDPASQGKRILLHPSAPADLDIYWYRADGIADSQYAAFGCGDVTGPASDPYRVPTDAAWAIVVLWPNPTCSNVSNVAFAYSTYAN